MKTQLYYSRKADARGYQVIDASGKVLVQFGSGCYERYRAERFQLQLERPDILRVADRVLARYPELRGRLLRGAQLCASGHVELNGAEGRYYVRSQSNNDVIYDVDTELGSCTCLDWENGLLGLSRAAPWCGNGPKCEHLVAAYMAHMLGR